MKIDGQPFEIQIVGQDGQVVEHTPDGYVGLAPKEQYSLRITNRVLNQRAAVQFVIDGTPLTNRIVLGFNQTADIETIPNTGKKLTAFLDNSDEGKQALLNHVSDENLGLISATFSLEKRRIIMRMAPSRVSLSAAPQSGAMGTGLSGTSNQAFQSTTFEDDPKFTPVTMYLRLREDPTRQIDIDASPIPGRQTETPIPAPVPRQK